MTHPEDLLADYVRGTLAHADRAALASHLASCPRCTEEIAAASVARGALAALPGEVAPASIAEALGEAVEAAPAGLDRGAPTWQRWLGPAAAVAAAALVLILVLPKLGGGSSSTSAASPEATTAATISDAAPDVRLELEATDYTAEDLDALTTSAAQEISTGNVGEPPQASLAGVPTRLANADRTQAAAACIQQAFQQVPGAPTRLIRARFEGSPAYIGFYPEGPGVGQPADALTVRVASVRYCTPLSIAQVPL